MTDRRALTASSRYRTHQRLEHSHPESKQYMAWYMVEAEAETETVMETWHRQQVTLANNRHARRESKESAAKHCREG